MTQYIQQHHIADETAVDYASAIITQEDECQIASCWYAALLCQENGFKAEGTDGRGSFSISQMQVETARIVARHLKEPWAQITPAWMEKHPLTMIRYGAKHFHDLLREFHGNYFYATRAYNAGDKRIRLAQLGSKRWSRLSVKYYERVLKRYEVIKAIGEDDVPPKRAEIKVRWRK